MKLCGVFAVVLCAAATSFGAISVVGTANPKTLVYSNPSDLGTGADIDPAGLMDVQMSYGVSKAAFQARSDVQVIGFNGGDTTNPNVAPASFTHQLGWVVANYSDTGTVTFTFPTPDKFTQVAASGYNFGGPTTSGGPSAGRGAFSGDGYNAAIGTVVTESLDSNQQKLYSWFDAAIATTGDKGVSALGFCVAFRNNQNVFAGNAAYTLSDGSVETIPLPELGALNQAYEYIFLGYEAPAGKTIARVQASLTTGVGGAFTSIDDIAFVMTPEPATMALLALGGLFALRRRSA